MTIFDALILALAQGLIEFLPISSSAYLRILGPFPTSGDPGSAFTAVVQIGTEVAVLLHFRYDIVRIASQWLRAWASPCSRQASSSSSRTGRNSAP